MSSETILISTYNEFRKELAKLNFDIVVTGHTFHIYDNEKRTITSAETLKELKTFIRGFKRSLHMEVEAREKMIELLKGEQKKPDPFSSPFNGQLLEAIRSGSTTMDTRGMFTNLPPSHDGVFK